MIKIICDVCENAEIEGSNVVHRDPFPIKITDAWAGTDHDRGLYLCNQCRESVGTTLSGIVDAMVEGLRAKVKANAPVGSDKTGDLVYDNSGNPIDKTPGHPELIEGPKVVPAAPVPVVVPSESELIGVECKCGIALTVDNWCEGGICNACFKKSLEDLPVEVESEAAS